MKPHFPGVEEGKWEGGGASLWLWLMAMIKSWGDQRLPGAAGAEFPGAGGGGRRKGIEVGSARGGQVMLGRC